MAEITDEQIAAVMEWLELERRTAAYTGCDPVILGLARKLVDDYARLRCFEASMRDAELKYLTEAWGRGARKNTLINAFNKALAALDRARKGGA